MAQASIEKLSDDNFQSSIQSGTTLVDFHADWCGPCRMLAPVLEEVASELQGKAKVAKLDIDASQKTASEFQVSSVPTMILFKDGKEVARLVGLRDKDTIKDFITNGGN